MNEQEIKELLERIAALESKNAALENKFIALEKQVDTINKFVSAITESQSIETTMNEIESVAKQLTDCDKATFYCYDNAGDKFFSHGDYRNWQDTQSADELKKVFVGQKIQNKQKEAVIPLVTSKGKSVGVIVAEKEKGFKKSDFEGFKKGSQMMNTVELALKKEFEHQGRITDELTNLKNRQGLNEYLKNTLCGNLNDGQPANIVMCDIDHFKAVNDTYGHEAGDTILKGVAAVLNDGTRDGADCAFRMGGEEMVLILNCAPEKAVDIAERLRVQIENTVHTVMQGDTPTEVKVTVSMGVCDIRPNINIEITPDNIREVFDGELCAADQAAYRAKNNGRNQVVSYDERVNKAYLTYKAAEILCGGNSETIPKIKDSIVTCLESKNYEMFYSAIDALQDYAAKNPQVSKAADILISKICSAYGYDTPEAEHTEPTFDKAERTAESKSEVKYYNKDEYGKIENKFFLNVTAAAAYKIAQKAQAEGIQFSVKYNGDKSVVTLDGERDKPFIDSVKKEFAPPKPEQPAFTVEDDFPAYDVPTEESTVDDIPPYIPPNVSAEQKQQPERKKATFYNREEYKDIQNKTFIGTDAKTAYDISKFAEKSGVQFSAKFDGKNSAVTVDGVKSKGFIETVRSISAWSDKVQIKAAKSKEQLTPSKNTNRGR